MTARLPFVVNISFNLKGNCSKIVSAYEYDSSNERTARYYTYEITKSFSCESKFSLTSLYDNDDFGTTKPKLRYSIERNAGHIVPGWTSDGNGTHSAYCSLCEQTITKNCSGGKATCQNKAVCTTCQSEYGSVADHNYINITSLGNGQHKSTCEWCSKENPVDCSFKNGICSVCGGYQQAEKNDEDCYEISNLGQLMWFSQKVNAQEITSHSAMLTADITIDDSVVWTPISLKDKCGSTFDGKGHTITFANTKEGSTFGLFGGYNYSTIQNLYLTGSITCNQSDALGVLAKSGYRLTVKNVISTVSVTNSGDASTGGLVGRFGGKSEEAMIQNCAVYADIQSAGRAGGLIGENWGGTQHCFVQNSAYMGDVTGGTAGAIMGYNGLQSGCKSRFTDVYYCEKDGLDVCGGTYGGTITATRVESKTAEQFQSGEVAYLLNNGVTDGKQVWYQTCNTDSYPKFKGKTVYRGYVCSKGDSDPIYANSLNGLIINPTSEHSYDEEGLCVYCKAGKPADLDTTENVYKIYTPGELKWFGDTVNGGETAINGKLMADIDVSSLTSLAIGANGKAYSGTFDGNGYAVSINLKGSQNVALFPYVNGAAIKNLTVKGCIGASGQYAGSLVGQSEGDVTIEKCISEVDIVSSVYGDGTHGGLVGVANSGTLNINNCGFAGSIGGSKYTHSCAGLVGWSSITTNISNSFVAASFEIWRSKGNTFARGNVTLTNCYYLNSFNETPSGATWKNADKFASGEVAYLLNGSKSNGVWKQTLQTDAIPNFSGETVYLATEPCPGYSNSETKDHNYDALNCCTVCGELKLSADGYYEIDNAEKLFYFAQLVNKGEYDINARLMADLDLTGKTWTPIAYLAMSDSATVGYTGIFDGNGYVISNITIIKPTSATANGFFGIITTGTVKKLGIDGLTFDNTDHDHRAGGIAGQLMTGGSIENCFVVNSTIKASKHVVGGIVGMCKGTVKNCYTANLTLAGHTNRFGGITGDYKDGSIVNCYTDHTALGSTADSVGTKDALSQTSVNIGDFASGKITWLLNDNSSEGVWKQNIGTGNYPSFKGAAVYKTTPCVSYSNTGAEKQHNFDGNIICKNCAGYQQAEKNDEDCYEISNLSQLLWFADKVNNGETSINGKLMNDIDATSLSYLGIGKDASNAFAGVFDGNNKTLKIALVSKEQYVAPFPYVNGATIKNLTVSGTIKTTHKFAAGIVGRVDRGNAKLEDCLSLVEIDSTSYTDGNKNDGTHGGLIAVADGGTTTISSCGFAGSIIGKTTTSCGGIVGWAGATVNISNSFVAAKFELNNNSGDTFARNQKYVTVTNCYYLNALNDAMYSGATQATADRFASGEIAYILQGTRQEQIWGQKIGTDTLPKFSEAKVYEDTYNNEKIYRNDIEGNKILSLGADKKSAIVVLDDDGAYTIAFADYEDMRLANLKAFEVTVDKAQAVRVTSDEDFTLGTGDKIMLWKNLKNPTPMCEAYEVK